MSELHAVIMAGGSGTRFWPASRRLRPKQLLPLANGEPLLRATVDRLGGAVDRQNVWIVTNAGQIEGIRAALPDFRPDRILAEPESRDTAPCVALSVAAVEAEAPGATVVFLPADQIIEPADRFAAILRRGAAIAAEGHHLVTLGIKPTFPATGYGYIEPGEAVDTGTPRACHVNRFLEKPDHPTAERLVAEGETLWNAGIFIWRFDAIHAAMESGSPDLGRAAAAMLEARRRDDQPGVERAFLAAPRTSIDYAVMERATNIVVVESDLAWHDLGSFLALGAISPTDAHGNVRHLASDASDVLLDTRDCVVYAEGAKTVGLLGVSDLVVVVVDDAVVVCPRSRAGELRDLRAELERRGRSDLL